MAARPALSHARMLKVEGWKSEAMTTKDGAIRLFIYTRSPRPAGTPRVGCAQDSAWSWIMHRAAEFKNRVLGFSLVLTCLSPVDLFQTDRVCDLRNVSQRLFSWVFSLLDSARATPPACTKPTRGWAKALFRLQAGVAHDMPRSSPSRAAQTGGGLRANLPKSCKPDACSRMATSTQTLSGGATTPLSPWDQALAG